MQTLTSMKVGSKISFGDSPAVNVISSSPNVTATLANGVLTLTATKEGTATIVSTYANGSVEVHQLTLEK